MAFVSNGAWDASRPVVRRAQILQEQKRSGRLQHAQVTLQSWREGEAEVTLAARESFLDHMEPGDEVRVVTHRGRWGWEWVDRITSPVHDAILAVIDREMEALVQYLHEGGDPNLRIQSGEPLLVLAAQKGNLCATRLLLCSGARVNESDAQSRTALYHASARGDRELVKALLDAGAQVDLADVEGATPADAASRQGHPDIVELLRPRAGK